MSHLRHRVLLDGAPVAVSEVACSAPRSGCGEWEVAARTEVALPAARRVRRAPLRRAVRRLQARLRGDDVVLEGIDADGSHLRWTFTEIAHDSFVWQGRVSRDGGASWFLAEEMRLRRR